MGRGRSRKPHMGARGARVSLFRGGHDLCLLHLARAKLELRDLAHGVELRVGQQVGGGLGDLTTGRPKLAAWHARVSALPSIQATATR